MLAFILTLVCDGGNHTMTLDAVHTVAMHCLESLGIEVKSPIPAADGKRVVLALHADLELEASRAAALEVDDKHLMRVTHKAPPPEQVPIPRVSRLCHGLVESQLPLEALNLRPVAVFNTTANNGNIQPTDAYIGAEIVLLALEVLFRPILPADQVAV